MIQTIVDSGQSFLIGILFVRLYFVDKQLNELAKEVLKIAKKVFKT
jgi:hypothetical protein